MKTTEMAKVLSVLRGKSDRVEAWFAAERYSWWGFETRTNPREYDWHGERRGEANHPTVLLQYTLDGWGAFASDDITRRVPVESMFVAILPSAHRYYLPEESPMWTFVWMIFRHPYVVQRVRERISTSGPVLAAPPDGPVMNRLLRFITGIAERSFADVLSWEQALFDLLFAYERACEQRTYPLSPRERLLEDVLADVSARLAKPIDVESIATRHGMSRSHFTHYFKATTGSSPAQFVTELRLREVASRLQQGEEKLQSIASACGFADANHLCKVFKRHFHVSPGAYRKQFR